MTRTARKKPREKYEVWWGTAGHLPVVSATEVKYIRSHPEWYPNLKVRKAKVYNVTVGW